PRRRSPTPAANAARSDVADRVRFEVRGASEPAEGRFAGSVDVVFFFEALHDMGHPVEALTTARDALRPGGRVVVVDERTLDAFTPDAPRWSGCSTDPASCTACPSVCPSGGRPAPAR
ncbi:MAG: methyltransferase domain-containing protein, partial [Lapillicoccus sp.]